MATGRKVYTLSRWQQCRATLGAWLPGSLLGLVLFGGVIYLFAVLPQKDLNDVQGAAQKQGRGVVISVNNTFGTKSPTQPPALASIEMNGEPITFWTHDDLKQNEPVQVTYRVGKSGRIHIDDIKPQRNAKP